MVNMNCISWVLIVLFMPIVLALRWYRGRR